MFRFNQHKRNLLCLYFYFDCSRTRKIVGMGMKLANSMTFPSDNARQISKTSFDISYE